MQDSQQGPGNGLDSMGRAAVAGEVRSEWVARGKEIRLGESWVARRPQRALSQSTGLETPLVRAQPSCQICRPPHPTAPRDAGSWGPPHILSLTTKYTA